MQPNLDLIIKSNILTMANQQPRAQAVGVKNGKIAAVGSLDELTKAKGNDTLVLDLKGKTVLPSFIDSHMHPVFTGMVHAGVDLSAVNTIDDTLVKIKKRVEKTHPGVWIQGFRFQDKLLQEKRFPTKQELDDISTAHPIIIFHNDLHFAMMNTTAMQQIDFPAELEGVQTNEVHEPTGYIEDPAILEIDAKIRELLDDEGILEQVILSAQLALQEGITSLHMKESLDVIRIIIQNHDRIPVRFKPLVLVTDINDMDALDEIVASDNLRQNACICLIADGTFDGHTAATLEPYTDDPSTWGMLFYDDEAMYRFMRKAHQADLQLSVHTVSDRATEQVLTIYEQILDEHPRKDHRHRFEHFEIPTREQLKRTATRRLAAGMQPMFVPVCEGPDLEGYRKFIGEERVKRSNAFRTIIDEGLLVAGGSDSPVTPMSALQGIQACLTHPLEEQRISLYEALRLFTINSAKIGFEEDSKGSIEKGKLADFVVLSQDPYQVPHDEIGNITVEMTILGGNIVYQNKT
jgi:predicted amidohydrolase YtcJ